jgi:hypothetical protein
VLDKGEFYRSELSSRTRREKSCARELVEVIRVLEF